MILSKYTNDETTCPKNVTQKFIVVRDLALKKIFWNLPTIGLIQWASATHITYISKGLNPLKKIL